MRLERGFAPDERMFFTSGHGSKAVSRDIAVVGNYPPTQCGIATFTADMVASIRQAAPDTQIDIYAMVSDITADAPEAVCHLVHEADRQAHRDAGVAIDRSSPDLVWLQHEFGIFGGDAGEWIIDMLSVVAAPLVVTLHTILPHPDAAQRRVMQWIEGRAARIMVMSKDGAAILQRDYGVGADRICVIEHGVPDRPFGRSDAMKAQYDLSGRDLMIVAKIFHNKSPSIRDGTTFAGR